MSIDVSSFRVREGRTVDLKKWPTRVRRFYDSTAQYESLLADPVKKLSERQNLLYAYDRYALLVILQAMGAAGKDGVAEELQHDFLWRTTARLPERGRIGIFNRSYYEDVLVVRVHPEILNNQRLPDQPDARRSIWEQRYESIVGHERHLHRNGTRIVKFFLHLSRDEQRRRFLARIDNPDKNWKFSAADVSEHGRWKDYMRAYEDCLEATSTARAPWYVVPADDKKNARLIVSRVLLDTMGRLKMRYPAPDRAALRELQAVRRTLLRGGRR